MPNVVDTLVEISKTIENILDFIANDEVLSKDFEQYLEINNIEINSEKQFNNIIFQYMLDMKMQSGLRVLEYYRRNNPSQNEIIDALLNSFCSVFKVNKILSNGFEVTCLTSKADLELVSMVKMNHLKQVGRYDFINARILELGKIQYIIEIYDIISEFDVYKASTTAIRYMLQNPVSAYFKNDDKKEALEKSVVEFYDKFQKYFKNDYVITTNKKVDKLIESFNNYRLTGEENDYSDLVEKVKENRFFKVKELNCDDETFMETAVGGFSSHEEVYDVGLWIDKKRGLYIVPFLETFFKCFEGDVEGKTDCIKEFLTSDKVPPSVLKYAEKKHENFFETINSSLDVNFSNLEEILFNTKTAYLDSGVFSPVTVLFNSELFSSLIGVEEKEIPPEDIKRNELCPCGSGLKYKKCCGKNT